MLLREILDVSDEFEAHVGRQLTVNPTDRQAMEHLMMSGPLAPTELARRLGITTAAVTTAVDRLEALGHVTRTQNPNDRRGLIIAPTAGSVAKAMQTLMPMVLGIDGVLDGFTQEERTTIELYLDRVVSAYRAQLTPGDAPARNSA